MRKREEGRTRFGRKKKKTKLCDGKEEGHHVKTQNIKRRPEVFWLSGTCLLPLGSI